MNATLKLRKTGNSLATTWPRDVLRRLKVNEGDTLHAIETPHGILVTPYDPAFAAAMDAADEVINRDRDALKTLSKR